MKLNEQQALHRLAAYCSKAERCEFDVKKKLIAWELSQDESERIMKRLKDEKFVDNKRFCQSFINDKIKFNKWGEKKIVFELRKKQIAENDYLSILRELDKEDFEEQLIHILKQKVRSISAKDEYDRKTKLIRFALGRGYSMDQVIRNVNKLLGGEYEEDSF